MRKSKTGVGLGQRTIVILIFVLAVSIAMFAFSTRILEAAESTTGVEQCKLSVRLASYKVVANLFFWHPEFVDNPFQIQGCETNHIKITEERILGLEERIRLPEVSSDRKERLKKFVLDEMANCWNQFGKAGSKVWDADINGVPITTDLTACLVCAEIIIDSDFPRTELDNMYSYAKNEMYSRFGTYSQYFLDGHQEPKFVTDKTIIFDGSPGPNNPYNQYSIVFAVKEIDNVGFWGPYKSLPAANSGIINCNLLATDYDKNGFGSTRSVKLNKDADIDKAVGCSSGGDIENGLVFGKVLEGRSDHDFTPESGFGTIKVKRRYPMTVRLLPTSDVLSDRQCERLF